MAGVVGRPGAGGRAGVEEPRAVHVQPQAVLAADGADGGDRLDGVDRPAAAVVRVLDEDQPRAGEVLVVRLDHRRDLLGADDAALPVDEAQTDPCDRRVAASLVEVVVRAGVEDDLVAGFRLRLDADEVAHGARGHEQRRLLAEQRGHRLLQPVDGGVLAVDVVADRRGHHGGEHGRGGHGDGVGTEVDGRGSDHGLSELHCVRAAGPAPRRGRTVAPASGRLPWSVSLQGPNDTGALRARVVPSLSHRPPSGGAGARRSGTAAGTAALRSPAAGGLRSRRHGAGDVPSHLIPPLNATAAMMTVTPPPGAGRMCAPTTTDTPQGGNDGTSG